MAHQIVFPKEDLAMSRTIELVTVGSELVLLVDEHLSARLTLEQFPDLIGDPALILGPIGGDTDAREVSDAGEHFIDARIILVWPTR
jgi:hypothetical protein